jgi:hypothetical protein
MQDSFRFCVYVPGLPVQGTEFRAHQLVFRLKNGGLRLLTVQTFIKERYGIMEVSLHAYI